jgi:hypothetical protein
MPSQDYQELQFDADQHSNGDLHNDGPLGDGDGPLSDGDVSLSDDGPPATAHSAAAISATLSLGGGIQLDGGNQLGDANQTGNDANQLDGEGGLEDGEEPRHHSLA